MTDTNDAVAAFLARGGKIAKVEAGASNGMTARDWYKAARDPVKVIEIDDGIDEAIAEREYEIGAAYGIQGVNDFRAGLRKHGAKAMLGWGE